MFKIILIAVLLALAVEARPNSQSRLPRLDGKIVGGHDATIEEYPYQISLQAYGSHFCGGSIIATHLILTAAHCTVRQYPDNLSIRYGSSIRGEGGNEMQVMYIHEHDYYNAATFDYDVSVLTLTSHVKLHDKAQIIGMVPTGTLEGGRSAVVTGWGHLSSGGSAPSQLQAVEVQEVKWEECNKSYGGKLTDTMICFMDRAKDACQGDSGGPLVSNGAQIGIVSWGYGCADPNYPGIYSHVEKLKDFIDV